MARVAFLPSLLFLFFCARRKANPACSTDEDEDADDLRQEGITLDNVIGRRTRGVVIDYAKAAAENPADDEEDEEDDGDFEEPDDMDED